ncbi:MAG: peptide chain release factor N(5)-glutamine methyltransferase [Anaerolineae bacterium]|nr:peptide chain release factor N(5)-glutamine methyltransferase [Anaerolineae bacterium]
MTGTVNSALQEAAVRLTQAGCDTPQLDAELLLAHVLEQGRTWLYSYPQTPLTPDQLAGYWSLISRRERREPVAYLTGVKAFFGLDFLVNKHVLIPRPETELLVEVAIAHCQRLLDKSHHLSIVDIGTGSGCIAITLARHLPDVAVVAGDISPHALDVARQNACIHGVKDRVMGVNGDLLQPYSGPFDLIVSNPPYISEAELRQTPVEVQQYEPRQALWAGADGLSLIRKLFEQAQQKVSTKGAVLVEIGAGQGKQVEAVARRYFPGAEIKIHKDLAGLDRVVFVRK